MTAAERALNAALTSGNAALITATRNTLALAEAQSLQATSALAAARATSAHGSQLQFASRGAGATALSMLGVRGATLAANASFLAGAAAIAVFAKSVSLAASFEEEMNVFRNAVKATEDQMASASERARELGRDISLPGVSAVDAAQTITLLAKAGLDVQNALDAARGSLQLATAAEIENAEAVRLVATALNTFELAGTEATHVADLLAAAANESQAEITDMGLALQQAAAVANLVGLEVDDTVALLTLLQKAGLRGSDAGTSLRTALIRLIAPTDKAKTQLAELNLQIRDIEGNLRPEIFAEFIAATEKLGRAGQQERIADIFGQDAIRAVSLIGRQGAAGLEKVQVAIDDLAAAEEAASARTEGFTGDIGALTSNLETLGTTLGEVALPPLSELVQGFTDAAGGAILLSEEIRDLANTNIPLVGELGDRLGDALNVATFVGPIGAVRQAGVVMNLFGDESEEAADKISPLETVMDSAAEAAKRLGQVFLDAAASIRATGEAAGLTVNQITGRIAGLEEQLVGAQITENRGQQIDLLRQQEEQIRTILERENLSTEARREFQRDLLAVIDERRGIQRGIASEREQAENDAAREAEQHAREVQRLRDEADRAFLSSIDLQEQRLQNRLLRAQTTASLQDDIQRNIELRNFYRRSLADVRSTVKDAETKAHEIANLTHSLIDVNRDINEAREELAEARRQERQEARERLQESLQLDVEIAQATGNRAAEIRAREAEINFIERQIRATRAGSLQRKRLILELRRAQSELRDLKAEQAKTGQDFKALTFEFLSTQQGFAANLLGNLLPSAATPGTVGAADQPIVPPSPLGAIAEATATNAAERSQGMTQAQATTLVTLTREMLRVLRDVHRGTGFPEARTQERQLAGALDVM